jgi:hypothetical protein
MIGIIDIIAVSFIRGWCQRRWRSTVWSSKVAARAGQFRERDQSERRTARGKGVRNQGREGDEKERRAVSRGKYGILGLGLAGQRKQGGMDQKTAER